MIRSLRAVIGGQLFATILVLHHAYGARTGVIILAFDHSALLNGRAQTACGPVYINTWPVLHLRRLTMPAGDSPSAPVHNTRRRLSVRAGLQLPRPTLPFAPVYNAAADSSVCAASDAAVVFTVRFSRPGLYQHTMPHLSA